jgi:hypothetical protein
LFSTKNSADRYDDTTTITPATAAAAAATTTDLQENDVNRTRKEEANVVTFQAFLYILAFFLTWIFTILIFLIDSDVIRYMKVIFQPLQGFTNAIIFLHHRVFNLKRSCPEIGFCEAIWKAIRFPRCVPEEFVSSTELVVMNNILSILRRGDDEAHASNSSSCPFTDTNKNEDEENCDIIQRSRSLEESVSSNNGNCPAEPSLLLDSDFSFRMNLLRSNSHHDSSTTSSRIIQDEESVSLRSSISNCDTNTTNLR